MAEWWVNKNLKNTEGESYGRIWDIVLAFAYMA